MKIIVIGGGIGGAAAANALLKSGHDVTVFERAIELKEVGAGIEIWANAMHCLKEWGLLDKALKGLEPITRLQLLDEKATVLIDAAIGCGDGLPAICIPRKDLHAVFLDEIPKERLKLGHALERLDEFPDKVRCHFTNGVTAEADLVIGADGINSVVRSELWGKKKPIYRYYVTWRGIVHMDNPYAPGLVTEACSKGLRFGVIPMSKDSIYWYASKITREGTPDSEAGRKADVTTMFKGWHDPIAEIIERAPEESILKHGMYDRKPLKQWGKGRVTLLGDAAHAMTADLGQGACSSIEDAMVLSRCLSGEIEPETALRTYEARRIPRTTMLVKRSLSSGKVAQWRNPLAISLRDTLSARAPKDLFEKKLRDIHSFRA